MRLRQIITILALVTAVTTSAVSATGQQPPVKVNFHGHIATIIHRNCAPCHHEGQAAPFNLITYQDVRKRATNVLEAVEGRIMPPWLAEHGYGSFSNERRLTNDELSLLRQWVEGGLLEGDPKTGPAPPKWSVGWEDGSPDLVVTMPKPYLLGAEGRDIYRQFVMHVPVASNRFVRAVEFSPGNRGIVHHAFIRVDPEGNARKLDGLDGQPGFTNMSSMAQVPDGQWLTWNPGTRSMKSPRGLSWRLRGDSDIVVEMHLNRTGKPESIQSSIGFYFTDEAPTNTCFTFKLGSFALEFPAGASNVVVRDSFVLPTDVDLLAVYPHAHFLCKQMKGYATRPDGTREWLFWIKKWDFNWQGDYRYTTPLHLAKGTVLHLEYSYDNSTNNVANPNHPPRPVRYGEGSSDEMCELGFQVLTSKTNDLRVLQAADALHRGSLMEAYYRKRLESNPDDAEALTRLGMVLWDLKGPREAVDPLDRAIKVRPDYAEGHYNKGIFLRYNGDAAKARMELEIALGLDPRYPKAHQQLGFAFASLGDAGGAERNLEAAIEQNPADTVARAGLAELRQHLKSRQETKGQK